MSLPSPRPELSLQLLDAIRHRDTAATGRFTRQWVHRHGVSSLADFRRDILIPLQGPDAGDWLQDQLAAAAGPPLPEADAACTAAPAVEDAFAALEAAFLPPAASRSAATSEPVESSDVSVLPGAALLRAIPAGTHPAPAPATLADLRSWLSAAPQHRRAS